MSNYYTLYLNGNKITATGFHIDMVNMIVDLSADISGLPGVTPPPPVEEPTPEPEIPSNVVRDYDFDNWPDYVRNQRLTVPKGKTVVSKFTTTSEDDQGGIFYQFEETARYDIWISEEPDGEPISKLASREGQSGISTKTLWRQGPGFSWYPELEKNKTYYLNMKHTDPNQEQTTILRMMQ